MKTPTIRDVAALANVSVATVSRVLNGQGGFSSDTRETVLSAIRTLNYKRNDLARNLKTSTSHTYGLITPYLNPMFESSITGQLQRYAADSGYSIMPFSAGKNAELLNDCLDLVEYNRLAGVFLLSVPSSSEIITLLEGLNKPCVSIMTRFPDTYIPFVTIDNKHAAYDATNYLIGLGHRSIALISGPIDDKAAGFPRYEGYLQAMRDAGLSTDERMCRFCNFSFEESRACFRDLSERAPEFTAVLCCSDEIAAGVLHETRLAGIRVPDDLSVSGFDNTPLSFLSAPPLTTYAIPYADIARHAEVLMQIQICEGRRPEGIFAEGKIIARDSVKKRK